MDIKHLLVTLAILNDFLVESCCGPPRKCIRKQEGVICEVQTVRRRSCRSIDCNNGTSTDILQRIGTEFSISLEENPCSFETYDSDNDGIITKEELEAKFGVTKETKDLLAFIDTADDDGIINKDEFCFAAPQLIRECKGSCYP